MIAVVTFNSSLALLIEGLCVLKSNWIRVLGITFTSLKIPAKKWGDTEIAERGRSVLVMRARIRARVMLFVRIADPLSGTRAGS